MIDKNLQIDIWKTHCLSGNVFAGFHASVSTSFRNAQVKKAHAMGNVRVQVSTGKPVEQARGEPVAESGNRNHDTIPTPRFPRSPSARKFVQPCGGGIFEELWCQPTKTSNLGPSL